MAHISDLHSCLAAVRRLRFTAISKKIYENLQKEAKEQGVKNESSDCQRGCFSVLSAEKGPIVKFLPEDSFLRKRGAGGRTRNHCRADCEGT